MAFWKARKPQSTGQELHQAAAAKNERILRVVSARDLNLGGASLLLGASATRLFAMFPSRPEVVMELSFDLVTSCRMADGIVDLVQSDPQYARELNDPANPMGETNWRFELPASELGVSMWKWLDTRLFALSPIFAEERSYVDGLRARIHDPVSLWDGCPHCGGAFTARVDGAASCTTSGRAFCDPGLEPVVSDDPADYGHVVGVQQWQPPLETFSTYTASPTAWIYRPKTAAATGPFVIPETRILDLVKN